MNILSYKQLIALFKDIAQRHYQINTYFVGKDSELSESKDLVFPVFQVYPEFARMPQSNGDYKTIIVDFNCKIIDQVNQNEINEIDVHSDCLRIAQDVVNELNQHPYYQRSNASLIGDISFSELEEFEDDFSAGWQFTLSVELINNNSYCGLPFEEITGYSAAGPVSTGYSQSVQYLTCSNLTACTSFQNYVQDAIDSIPSGSTANYYTTGATLIGTTAYFDRNDLLNAYEVQLSGLTSGITATGAYLNLSGGTVTGNTNFTVSLTANSISATTLFVTNEKWTIELVDALTAVFYAPYAMQINSITNILNSPSIAIYDDGALYTLTNTIATGSKILVSANTASVVSLNATK